MEVSGSEPIAENRGRSYVTDGTNILFRARTQRECVKWWTAQHQAAHGPSVFSTGKRASQKLLEQVYRTMRQIETLDYTRNTSGSRQQHSRLLKNKK